MRNILLYALSEEAGLDKAEAVVEFLIALMTGRMTLYPTHLIELCRCCSEQGGRYGVEIVKLLARYITSQTRALMSRRRVDFEGKPRHPLRPGSAENASDGAQHRPERLRTPPPTYRANRKCLIAVIPLAASEYTNIM